MKNWNSSKNQEIKGQFVEREVTACASQLINELSDNDAYRELISEEFYSTPDWDTIKDNFIGNLDEDKEKEICEHFNVENITEIGEQELCEYADVDFVYPMHLNPNVRKPIYDVFGKDIFNIENMFFIEPLEYLSFVYLMEKSTLVLTDSGGIQEEAPGLSKPVLVMRDTTERPEALASGTVHLVGTDYQKIMDEVSTLLEDEQAYEKMSKAVNPYGDGKACERIVEILKK